MSGYISPTYEPIGPVTSFHNVPRFGFSGNITDIFSADGSVDLEKLSNYIIGSIFVTIFLMSTYVVFLLFVIIFKFCYGKKAGILAGHPFVFDKSIISTQPRKNIFFRTFILILTIGLIAAGGTFLMKGGDQLNVAVRDVRNGSDRIKIVAQNVVDATDLMIEYRYKSVIWRDNLADMIDQGLCQSFQGGNTNSEEAFDASASAVVDLLNGLQNFASSELTDIRTTFATDIIEIGNMIDGTADTVETIAKSAYYGGPTIALGSLLLIGLILAWFEVPIMNYFCIQKWITMPLFFILIFVSVILVSAIAAILVANSDFCVGNADGTPEGTMKVVVDKCLDFEENTMTAINYYALDGCIGEYNQLVVVNNLLTQLSEASHAANELNQIIDLNKDEFEVLCGGVPGSFDPLQYTIGMAIDAFEDMMDIGNQISDVASCENINSIWVDIAHDAVCMSSPSAFAWMYSSVIVVYLSGIFIYLFRGALLPTEDLCDRKYEDNSYKDKYTSYNAARARSEYSYSESYEDDSDY